MKRQPGYAILFWLTLLFTALAVLTVLPLPASKPNVLGYVSHCSFTPWSTLILVALAGLSCFIRLEWFKTRTPSPGPR
jgi:hypothetical protein